MAGPPSPTDHQGPGSSGGEVSRLASPPGRISGTCRKGHRPAAGLRIDILDSGDIVVDTQTTGPDGRFTTRLLFAGTYRVRVREEARVVDEQTCRVQLGEVTRVDVTLPE